jgi:hypothetical protein
MSRIEAKTEELKQAHSLSDSLLLDDANSQNLTEFFQHITEIDMCLQSGNPEYEDYQRRKSEVMDEVRALRLGNDEVESFVESLTGQR